MACPLLHLPTVFDQNFRHLGGGRKGVFLLLRYVFILAASYLLLFRGVTLTADPVAALMIAAALGSNVLLSLLPQRMLFAWYVEAPILIADTLWVSWALHSTGALGSEFFLLYGLVLFLSVTGERVVMVVLGSVAVGAANVYLAWDASLGATPLFLRLFFFFAVALFYGQVLSQIRRERQRADRGFAWAHELEAKVTERTAELQGLYHESLAASRAKSEFVDNMSHELRTPLNIVIGYADMLREECNDAQSEMLGRLRESAAGLLAFVDDVLDLGRLDSKRMPLHIERLSVSEVFDRLRDRRLPAAPTAPLPLEADPALPPIETDAQKLALALDNLIGDAHEFTGEGGITVSARKVCERVEFHVNHPGVCIAHDEREHVFEPFRRLPEEDSHAWAGVGLSFTLAQRYVALLGGEIRLESTLEHGTSFVVSLPGHGAEAIPHAAPSALASRERSPLARNEQPPDGPLAFEQVA